jgi:RimJ/RimL family protein N-acetyltransferase
MSPTYLKTERVLLRQYLTDDFDRLLDLNSDPEVMRYLTNGVPSTREEVASAVERTLLYQKKFDGKLGVFTAELLRGGEFMGWFHLRPDKADLENTRELELGYRLKRKFWGKGYATEVSLALVDKAFGELRAECVWAKTLAENMASRRVMEKVGLRFEREFIDSAFSAQVPSVRYRLFRAEWE